ncbi:hypothetical protein C1632_14450 [Microbacterium testaceum]|nr:hypothetical protein C1632_14450 [Microbacterium testaceum]
MDQRRVRRLLPVGEDTHLDEGRRVLLGGVPEALDATANGGGAVDPVRPDPPHLHAGGSVEVGSVDHVVARPIERRGPPREHHRLLRRRRRRGRHRHGRRRHSRTRRRRRRDLGRAERRGHRHSPGDRDHHRRGHGARDPRVAVRPDGLDVVGAAHDAGAQGRALGGRQFVVHARAPSSASSSRNFALARASRDLTVPAGMPRA